MNRYSIRLELLVIATLVLFFIATGCSTHKSGMQTSASSKILKNIKGSWQNLDTKVVVTIKDVNGFPTAVSIIDDDGEEFVVLESKVEDNTFKWTYKVPSTGYVVTGEVKSISGKKMMVAWANQNASGDQEYKKIK